MSDERDDEVSLTEFAVHLDGGNYVQVTAKYEEPAQLWDAIQKTIRAAGVDLGKIGQRVPFYFPEAVIDARAVQAIAFVFDDDEEEAEEYEAESPKSFSGGV